MSVIVKNACRIINLHNNVVDGVDLDFSKRGSESFYIQNVTDKLLHDIVYKTSHPSLTIDGPIMLPSWPKATVTLSWEPCEEDHSLTVHSKMM